MTDGRDSNDGQLLYIKASLTGDEPADVIQYYRAHNDFPHESTANQFFNESQFESYVRLGAHIVQSMAAEEDGPFTLEQVFKNVSPGKPKAAGAASGGLQL
jgi:hypothetical protein